MQMRFFTVLQSKSLGYFRYNRSRMKYHHVAKVGCPIGSGEVEAAINLLVTQHLKRSIKAGARMEIRRFLPIVRY